MLGEQIFEEIGQVIARRTLPDGKLENTTKGRGKLLDVEVMIDMVDVAEFRPDGTSYIEGKGMSELKRARLSR